MSRIPASISVGQRVVHHRLVVDRQQLFAHRRVTGCSRVPAPPARMIPLRFMRLFFSVRSCRARGMCHTTLRTCAFEFLSADTARRNPWSDTNKHFFVAERGRHGTIPTRDIFQHTTTASAARMTYCEAGCSQVTGKFFMLTRPRSGGGQAPPRESGMLARAICPINTRHADTRSAAEWWNRSRSSRRKRMHRRTFTRSYGASERIRRDRAREAGAGGARSAQGVVHSFS